MYKKQNEHINFRKSIFFIINAIILIVALCFSYYYISNNYEFISLKFNLAIMLLILIVFACTHFVKLIRLYLIMIEMNIRFNNLISFYIKTTFVNIVIPYKLGEVYRLFALSEKVKDFKSALLVIITDRFFDSIVLLMFVVPYQLLNNSISIISIILFVFLIVILFAYSIFPSIYLYFNNHWFFDRLSKKSNIMLKFLHNLSELYKTEKSLVHNRAFPILFLSIISWCLDFTVLFLISKMISKTTGIGIFVEFINDAFAFTSAHNLVYYILLALVFFVALMIYNITKTINKKVKNN